MKQEFEQNPFYYAPPEHQPTHRPRHFRTMKILAIGLIVLSWVFWITSLVFVSFDAPVTHTTTPTAILIGFFLAALFGCAAQGAGFVFLLLLRER